MATKTKYSLPRKVLSRTLLYYPILVELYYFQRMLNHRLWVLHFNDWKYWYGEDFVFASFSMLIALSFVSTWISSSFTDAVAAMFLPLIATSSFLVAFFIIGLMFLPYSERVAVPFFFVGLHGIWIFVLIPSLQFIEETKMK